MTEAGDVANYDQTIDMEEEERMYVSFSVTTYMSYNVNGVK